MMDWADRQIAELRIKAVEQRLAYQAEIARLKEVIAEMCGDRPCNCETLAYAETEVISLRASLGQAIEALEAALNDFHREGDIPSVLLIRAVLSDPEGERANVEWVAMRECVEALRPFAALYDPDWAPLLTSMGASMCVHPKVRVTDMQRAHDSLRRLEEVRKDA